MKHIWLAQRWWFGFVDYLSINLHFMFVVQQLCKLFRFCFWDGTNVTLLRNLIRKRRKYVILQIQGLCIYMLWMRNYLPKIWTITLSCRPLPKYLEPCTCYSNILKWFWIYALSLSLYIHSSPVCTEWRP